VVAEVQRVQMAGADRSSSRSVVSNGESSDSAVTLAGIGWVNRDEVARFDALLVVWRLPPAAARCVASTDGTALSGVPSDGALTPHFDGLATAQPLGRGA
jgi:hypothetical protein